MIQTLFEVLTPYSDEFQKTKARDDIREIQGYIINSLPAPIAEDIRKLFAATREFAAAGYDQPGLARLKQLIKTYRTLVEMIGFSIIAQIWDLSHKHEQLERPKKLLTAIKNFLSSLQLQTPQE